MGTFLLTSGFFAAWDGRAHSVAPARNASEVQEFQVRIVTTDGGLVTAWWPRELLEQLTLPVHEVAVAPSVVPDDRPETKKSRFSLSFDVHIGAGGADARWVSVPTAAPRDLGLGVLVWLLAIALRNMVVSGSPIGLERADDGAPDASPPLGKVVPFSPRGGHRPKPGPPPPSPRRGRGRR